MDLKQKLLEKYTNSSGINCYERGSSVEIDFESFESIITAFCEQREALENIRKQKRLQIKRHKRLGLNGSGAVGLVADKALAASDEKLKALGVET